MPGIPALCCTASIYHIARLSRTRTDNNNLRSPVHSILETERNLSCLSLFSTYFTRTVHMCDGGFSQARGFRWRRIESRDILAAYPHTGSLYTYLYITGSSLTPGMAPFQSRVYCVLYVVPVSYVSKGGERRGFVQIFGRTNRSAISV